MKNEDELMRIGQLSTELIRYLETNEVDEDDAIPALGCALILLVVSGGRMSRDHFVAWFGELYDAVAELTEPGPEEVN